MSGSWKAVVGGARPARSARDGPRESGSRGADPRDLRSKERGYKLKSIS